MYFGNEIKLTSDDLCYCLYDSKWIDQSLNYKKLMVIFMGALRQPEQIVIGKVFPLSLDVFMSVSNQGKLIERVAPACSKYCFISRWALKVHDVKLLSRYKTKYMKNTVMSGSHLDEFKSSCT